MDKCSVCGRKSKTFVTFDDDAVYFCGTHYNQWNRRWQKAALSVSRYRKGMDVFLTNPEQAEIRVAKTLLTKESAVEWVNKIRDNEPIYRIQGKIIDSNTTFSIEI